MAFKRMTVSAGEYKGRFIGQNFSGLRTNKDLLDKPEIPILGTGFSMYAQEGVAFSFIEANTLHMQTEFRKRGVETEIVD